MERGVYLDSGASGHQVGVAMTQTVRGNYEGFTKEQVLRTKNARDALAMMAHPRADRVKQVIEEVLYP